MSPNVHTLHAKLGELLILNPPRTLQDNGFLQKVHFPTEKQGTSQARRRQLRASSDGSSDATSKASFPLHNTEAQQNQGNLDVTSDVVLSCCCCPSADAEDNVMHFLAEKMPLPAERCTHFPAEDTIWEIVDGGSQTGAYTSKLSE